MMLGKKGSEGLTAVAGRLEKQPLMLPCSMKDWMQQVVFSSPGNYNSQMFRNSLTNFLFSSKVGT